jgi:RNA polymerase subunit RPABC4/transcription elongation factor Spt4
LNLSENLSNSFDYAKKMFSDIGRLIILIVLGIPILLIINWIFIGYAAKVLKETPSSDAPPRLEKYSEMFVDGAKIVFASLIYMIIPLILIFAGIAAFVVSIVPWNLLMQGGTYELGNLPNANPGTMAFSGVGLVLLLVGIVLAFFLFIIQSIGMTHMIKTGKFGKAFAFGEILGIIGRIGWLRYVGWAVLVFIIVAIVGGVAGAIPIIGWIISLVITPVLTVFIFRSLGLLYNEGAPPELRSQAAPFSAAGGIVCPSCGTALQPNQKFCPNCGAPAPAPPQPTMTEKKFCTNCGAEMPKSATFCGRCGAKQT